MTKWIVSTPLKGTDLMKNFVCFGEAELRKLLEQYPDASVEMKDSHLEDYPEMKEYSLISTAQTENHIQVKDVRYTLDEFNRISELLLGRNLTDNQQVVLEQLCQIFMKQIYKSKMQAVYIFIKKGMSEEFLRLDREESNQVLAAFTEWGSKEGNQ